MLHTRSRKILRDILARKGRAFLVILSIMIGVFGVTVMFSATDIINRQLEADVRPEAISNIHLYLMSTGQTITPAENQRILAQLQTLPGVVDAEGQAVYPVSWTQGSPDATDSFVVAFSEPFEQVNLEGISRIPEGRYPVSGQHEIAVEQHFAAKYAIKIGDKLTFTGSDAAWKVVGLVVHPYFTIAPAIQDQIPQEEAIYIHYEDAQNELGIPGLSAVHLRFATPDAAKKGLDPLVEILSQQTPYVPLFTFLDNPDDNFITGIIADVTGTLNMLGIMAVIVSGFLVTNVMNTIIVEQRKQIGMLKSLGATAKDTILIYTGIALIYGVVGSALGVALAIPAAALMAQSVGSAAFTYIDGFKISLRGIGIGFALGLLVPVVAAFFPVMSSIRVTILEAITDFGIASSWGKSRISRWIGGLPLPRLMVQALSNIYQKKGRLTLTGLTLTLAAAAFMGVSAVTQTLDSFVEGLFTSIKYELILSLQDGQNHEALTVLLSENFADIEGVYPGYSASVGIRGYESTDPLTEGSNQVSADGIDPANPAFAFNLREGNAWNADPARRGVVISRSLAENLDKTVGDSLTLTISGQDYDYEIIGVDNYAYDALYMNWRDLASLAGYVDANGVPLASTLYVDFKGDLSIKAVDDQKERIATFLRDRGMQVTFTNQPRAEQNQTQQISLFGVVFNMASGVMAAVGAVGLMAALSMAVFERQKEIGIMRSVGAGSFSILSQFLTEGVLIGALAWIGAAPLSVVVGLGLTQILPFDYLDFSYPPEVLGVGLVSILLLAGLASLLPAVAASRKTVADILRYQ